MAADVEGGPASRERPGGYPTVDLQWVGRLAEHVGLPQVHAKASLLAGLLATAAGHPFHEARADVS